MTISDTIKNARKAAGLTQKQLVWLAVTRRIQRGKPYSIGNTESVKYRSTKSVSSQKRYT